MNGQFRRQASAVLRILFARLRFLSVFLIVGFIVGYWDDIKNHYDKWTRPPLAPDALAEAAKSDVEYYCAMDTNIRRSEPGNCPICSMPLVKRKKGQQMQLPDDVLARVQLSPQRISLAGIQTTAVEPRHLVRQIHAVGILDYNETKVAQLSARVPGRADTLYLQYAGQAVKQGDPTYSLYSPEVYTAQREYLTARKRVNDLTPDAPPDARGDATAVYNASLQKLVLWGISREQLNSVDKEYDQTGKIPTHLVVTSPIPGIVIRKDLFEGGYVQVGDKPYTIADLGTLWLKAKIYEQDVPLVRIGQPVDVTVEAFPNEVFKGAVTFRAFQIDPQTRTLDARIEVKNADLRLIPGMFADAAIRVPIVAADAPATMPSTQPAGTPALSPIDKAKAFQAALAPYLEAQTLLSQDKAVNVSTLLHETVAKLQPIATDADIQQACKRLTDSVHQTVGQDLAALRKTFKDVSSAVIEIGKSTGLPASNPVVEVFHCPMAKANWLQKSGATANPFYGSSMLECGGAIEKLPRIEPNAAPTTRPAPAAGKVLAIPRSAVIDTGRHKIVYVESSPGVYDMRAAKLGALAGDYYPVAAGLEEGERVVTVGAFLIDAENRLNPTQTADAPPAPNPPAHQH